jgi:hypothetical protein
MTQIAWAIFTAAVIYGDAVRFEKLGAYYPSQGGVAALMGTGIAGLVISSVMAATC